MNVSIAQKQAPIKNFAGCLYRESILIKGYEQSLSVGMGKGLAPRGG